MKALKALVIAMAVIIVLGMAVVIATIVGRVSGLGGEAERIGTVHLGLAESCRVADVVEARGKLILRLSGPVKDGCGELIVVDPDTGATVGRIAPGAAPEGAEAGPNGPGDGGAAR